ncbi:MAG: hypothetical protein SFY66_21675 [Oculatellaceae cyanobacterium bins.114]|nr:hypothetical protein [Oculatellaceae cyanobacterium bins.114]
MIFITRVSVVAASAFGWFMSRAAQGLSDVQRWLTAVPLPDDPPSGQNPSHLNFI